LQKHPSYCNPVGSMDPQLQLPCEVQARSYHDQSSEASNPGHVGLTAHAHIQ